MKAEPEAGSSECGNRENTVCTVSSVGDMQCFFERAPDRAVAGTIDNTQFYDLGLQQPQGPACASLGQEEIGDCARPQRCIDRENDGNPRARPDRTRGRPNGGDCCRRTRHRPVAAEVVLTQEASTLRSVAKVMPAAGSSGYVGLSKIPSAPSAASAVMEPELGRRPPPSAGESATTVSPPIWPARARDRASSQSSRRCC